MIKIECDRCGIELDGNWQTIPTYWGNMHYCIYCSKSYDNLEIAINNVVENMKEAWLKEK